MSLLELLDQTAEYLRSKSPKFPSVALVLGSGLSGFVERMKKEQEIPYSEIPNFRRSTVQGHAGKLIIGEINGVRVACMQGRLHYFEGYTMSEVVFPVRALARAGVETFLLTNASGGVHPDMVPSDLALIKDHINLMGTNPLIGPNEPDLGPRFPDQSVSYDAEIRSLFRKAADKLRIKLLDSVYIGLHGPSFETPSEIKMYRGMGGDLVGMSTVPEVIALRHMGKRVAAVSCITNLAAGVTDEPCNHEEVLVNAEKSYQNLWALLSEVLPRLGEKS